ncbi:hypothetical protein Ciccas_005476 [Cichlidogyrus casuarinus]|uniref:Uncharacterized protein n=1 Tax=Cichlidogyrus casuarinus TaxID=1844966 RepID=A0ABD2Q8J8_9PLAT
MARFLVSSCVARGFTVETRNSTKVITYDVNNIALWVVHQTALLALVLLICRCLKDSSQTEKNLRKLAEQCQNKTDLIALIHSVTSRELVIQSVTLLGFSLQVLFLYRQVAPNFPEYLHCQVKLIGFAEAFATNCVLPVNVFVHRLFVVILIWNATMAVGNFLYLLLNLTKLLKQLTQDRVRSNRLFLLQLITKHASAHLSQQVDAIMHANCRARHLSPRMNLV